MSTSELVSLGMIQDLRDGLSLRPGSPCDNFQGYCDVFLKCRKVDAEGPLVRLKNLLFNQVRLVTYCGIWYSRTLWVEFLVALVADATRRLIFGPTGTRSVW